MKHLAALFLLALILSGCGQKADVKDVAIGGCSSAQSQLVSKHISGQIEALAEKDWDAAYSFASESFRKNIEIEQFVLIIISQYSMLVENQGYKFGKCTIDADKITQEVEVTSGEKVYYLTYRVSIIGSKLGIEAAVVGVEQTPTIV
jgi:hypothetical protein